MIDTIHLCDRCGCEQSPLRSLDGDVALGLVGLCDDCVTEEHLLAYRQRGRVTTLLLRKVWERRRVRPESPEIFSTWVPKTAAAIAQDAGAIEALIGAFRLSAWEGSSRSAGLRDAWRLLAKKKADGTTKGERGAHLREAHVVCGGTTLHLVCMPNGVEMTAQLAQQDGQNIRFHLVPYPEKDPLKAHAPAAVRATMHALKAMFAEVAFLHAMGDRELIAGPPPDRDVDGPKAKKKAKKTRKKAAKSAGKSEE